jgi:DNA-directed RNA polymerase subunit omega
LGAVDQAAHTLVAESKIMLEMEPTEPISAAVKVPLRIKVNYLEPALLRIPGPELLINVVRRRVRQLIQGHRPLTQTDARMDFSDIALKEIGEGKLTYELDAEEVEAVPAVPQPHDGGTPARF